MTRISTSTVIFLSLSVITCDACYGGDELAAPASTVNSFIMNYAASPNDPFGKTYNIVWVHDTSVKDSKIPEVYKLLEKHNFFAFPSNLKPDAGDLVCPTYELHSGDLYISIQYKDRSHEVSWDLGCSGFKNEQKLLKIFKGLKKKFDND